MRMIPNVFLTLGETIASSAERYECKIVHKQLAMVNRHGVPIFHVTGRVNVSQEMVLQYKTLPHPPYSHDLPSTNYHLFLHINHFLICKTFLDDQMV